MSKRDLLLEIGLEELPARFVTNSMNQLGEKVQAWLKDLNIDFGEVRLFSTPRRLAVIISDVAEKQEDIDEEAKGPAKKIALTADGSWSKAAIGFSRGQGATPEDIFFKEVNGVEYAFVEKHIKGQKTIDLLTDLDQIITSLTFPKNMKWGSYELRFARPIKWILPLFGQDVVPLSIVDVKSGNYTYGHRFLGEKMIIESPSQYEETLLKQYVLANPVKRKESIQLQIQQIEEEHNWVIPVDEDLLEEVTNLVEYPTALFGNFEEEYLSIPDEVLITTMKEHQRYFPVKDKNQQLLPHFVTIRNGDENHLENVARGNEKVLRARLSDAAFFYKEDQKLEISTAMEKLEKVVFHEELGTVGEKVRRVTKLAGKLADTFSLVDEKTQILRAASICKFDLVSQLVYEFPELQGIMGEKYAKILGEDEAVAVAINEHYMPRHAEDDAPETNVGGIIALADKLDTIAAFFSIGMIPTGSQDPYALRRQANGIVHILIAKNWEISLDELFGLALEQLSVQDQEKVRQELTQFFTMRLKFVLGETGIRYDIVDAILESTTFEASSMKARVKVIEDFSETADYKETIEALARVLNIAQKGIEIDINPALFENEYETMLFNEYSASKLKFEEFVSNGEFEQAFLLLASLRDGITQYFEHTMVMVENEEVKQNRLAQMVHLANIIKTFANVNALIVK